MSLSRRDFLAVVGAGGAAAAAIRPDLSSWARVRAEFDRLDPRLAHMSGFFLASHPRPVREAIESHRRGLDESPFTYIEDNIDRLEREARTAAADYLGARFDDLAMTDSTTMGLGTIYSGLQVPAGKELLSTDHDHPATRASLDFCARRTGATVRRIRLYQDPAAASADEMVAAVERALAPATRLLALTWVHSSTGVRVPLPEIAAVVAKANAAREPADRILLAVDGVHGLGIEDAGVADLGCDFFIAGCHKWMCGPRGTGLVWASPAGWALASPTIPTFDPMWRGRPGLPVAGAMTPGGFHSFEHRWALPEAFRFHQAVGKPRVAARIHQLNRQCKEGLARMGHVKLVTPVSDAVSAGIICFEVAGMTLIEARGRLRERGVIASVSPYHPPYLRLAPSLLTLERDVDKALREVRALGATPPRKPR